jgi:6-pyruvoyltetrahydropterin/6-carboxytetrahydropterin synthase
MRTSAERYHDISCGHRVAGHESKCQHMHGHNYRVHFKCEGELDEIGRVIDFSVIKAKLCMWLEDNWDHKFLVWTEDELMQSVYSAVFSTGGKVNRMFDQSMVWTDFNPTAENMAEYLVTVVGPQQLAGLGVTLVECRIEETRKCSATYKLD